MKKEMVTRQLEALAYDITDITGRFIEIISSYEERLKAKQESGEVKITGILDLRDLNNTTSVIKDVDFISKRILLILQYLNEPPDLE